MQVKHVLHARHKLLRAYVHDFMYMYPACMHVCTCKYVIIAFIRKWYILLALHIVYQILYSVHMCAMHLSFLLLVLYFRLCCSSRICWKSTIQIGFICRQPWITFSCWNNQKKMLWWKLSTGMNKLIKCIYSYAYVTGFVKIDPNHTGTHIHFIGEH